MKKMFCAVVVLLMGSSFLLADEFAGRITKVDGNKITVAKFGKKKGKKGETITLTVAKNCKINKGKFDREARKVVSTGALEGGLKNAMFKNLGKKTGGKKGGFRRGVFARIVTNADNHVTELTVLQFKGKRGGGKRKRKSDA